MCNLFPAKGYNSVQEAPHSKPNYLHGRHVVEPLLPFTCKVAVHYDPEPKQDEIELIFLTGFEAAVPDRKVLEYGNTRISKPAVCRGQEATDFSFAPPPYSDHRATGGTAMRVSSVACGANAFCQTAIHCSTNANN